MKLLIGSLAIVATSALLIKPAPSNAISPRLIEEVAQTTAKNSNAELMGTDFASGHFDAHALESTNEIFNVTDVHKMNIQGREFHHNKDCYYDVAQEWKQWASFESESYQWMQARGYNSYFSEESKMHYNDYDQQTLQAMVENGDTTAMTWLAFELALGENADAETIKASMSLLERKLAASDYTALYSMETILTMAENSTEDKSLQKHYADEKAKWRAVGQSLNAINLLDSTWYDDDFSNNRWKSWAEDKVESINQQRRSKGQEPLVQTSLPKKFVDGIKDMHHFQKVQNTQALNLCR